MTDEVYRLLEQEEAILIVMDILKEKLGELNFRIRVAEKELKND